MKYPLQNFKEDTIANVGGIASGASSLTLGSGNFTANSGTQKTVLILDYDSSSLREITTGIVNGTAVTSLTRALGGTSAQAHSQNAKVLMAFTTLHYDWIANAIQDGWVDALETWTYASASTFTIAADVTGILNKGDKLRLKQGGGYKYFWITAISYSNPNTTVTVKDGIDGATYTLANSAITDNYYSKAYLPNGFPLNSYFFDMCKVYRATNQTISNNTDTAIQFDNEGFDTNAMHDNASNNTRITIKEAGDYLVTVSEAWTANTTGTRQGQLKLNGTTTFFCELQVATSSGQLQKCWSRVLHGLVATDYIELVVNQQSGGNLDWSTGTGNNTGSMTVQCIRKT